MTAMKSIPGSLRPAAGRCLTLATIVLLGLLVALWPRLSLSERLFLGLSVFLAHLSILAGTVWSCSGWFAPVVRRFSPSGKEVWLTLDDGPHPRFTVQTMEVLARHDARATFFVIGREADHNPELLRAMTEAGHGLGNHTHSHPYRTCWCRPRWWLGRDVDRCTRVIEQATGEKPALFRAPVGMASPATGSVVAARSLRLIGWSVRGIDAKFGSPEVIAERVLRQVRPGAIILMHPERRPESVAALDMVLAGLSKRGYRCVIPNPRQFA